MALEKTVEINEDATSNILDDGSTTKQLMALYYTVAADGTVTLSPRTPQVKHQQSQLSVKMNGTSFCNLHTNCNSTTPTATPAETTDIQGATQTGKPVFIEGDSRVPVDTQQHLMMAQIKLRQLTALVLHTVAADEWTFVPEKSFVGTRTSGNMCVAMNGTKSLRHIHQP